VLKINRPDGHPPWSGRVKALYGNHLQRTCDRPDTALKQERFSAKISKILLYSCPSGRLMSTVQTASVHIVSILALFCVWTKSLMCNDVANMDSTFRGMSEDSACESEEFQVPCQPFGRCVIPSGCPSVYCSIHPNDVSFRSDIRQTSIVCPDDVLLPSGHLHRIEKLLCQLSPSGRFSSTSGRLSVLERFTDSFQVSRKGRSINRPDAYLRKARIAVQNGPSGRLTAVVRTLVHRIW
jgi:hypothetical protein